MKKPFQFSLATMLALVTLLCLLVRVFVVVSSATSTGFATLSYIYYGFFFASGAVIGKSSGRPVAGAACGIMLGLLIGLLLYSHGLAAPGIRFRP